MRVTLLLPVACAFAFFAFAGAARALTGDTPIAPVGPADGATVNAVEEGLKVTYTCPAYRTAEEVEEAEIETRKKKLK